MNNLFRSSLLLVLLFFSFSVPGNNASPKQYSSTSLDIKVVKEDNSDEVQDSLYIERIKNVNRIALMEHAINQMASR